MLLLVGKRLIAVRLACFLASYEIIVQTITNISAVRVTNGHKHGRPSALRDFAVTKQLDCIVWSGGK